MTDRRTFIQGGIAAAAMAAPALNALSATFAAGPSLPLYKVVFDERFAASRSFGAETERLGAKVAGIRGAVHDLWYHDLSVRWRTSAAAIAGMTDFQSLFLLETMAMDLGMRAVYRVHHRPGAQGAFAHEVFGSRTARESFAGFHGRTDDWSCLAASIVVTWPVAECRLGTDAHSNLAAANRKGLGRDALVTWVIAPVQRA